MTNNKSFDDSCEYIFFAQYDKELKLKFTPKDFDYAYCGAWLNGWIYEMCLALDIQWQLVSFEFMQQLLEFAQASKDPNTNPQNLPYFSKYFTIDNKVQTKMPKFINYISHDEILGAFYRAIGWSKHVKGALPASSLYFEFFTRVTNRQFLQERFLNDELSLQQAT